MESLQIELIMDILCRVPTLDLLKLTSVCRRWRNIILDDPLFRRFHHAFVMSNPNQNLVLLVKRRSELYWVDLRDRTSPRQVAISLPHIPDFSDYHFIGSCNGLLCLANSKCSSILVMNPFTRYHVVIPMPQEKPMFCYKSWGFGFDEVTKLFKVVAVFFPCFGLYKSVEVRVYDLGRANSINWRSVVVTNFPAANSMDMASFFFNGKLHWTYWTRDNSIGIISFDLAVEEFRPIPTPDNLLFQEGHCLTVFGGCLCLLKIQTETRPARFLIWVMKEYGIKASWVKELNTYPFIFSSLNPDIYRFEVLGSGKDGELVIWESNGRREEAVFLYSDSTCDEFERLQLERQPYWDGSIIHTATLSWI